MEEEYNKKYDVGTYVTKVFEVMLQFFITQSGVHGSVAAQSSLWEM